MRGIEWMIQPHVRQQQTLAYVPASGDLSAFNSCRRLLDAVGRSTLGDIVTDYLGLLDTSAAVYEANGDYALGIFASGWCRTMEDASFRLCGTDDPKQALDSGCWHCHESCWHDASLAAMQADAPVDIPCAGGINLYAVPIHVGSEIIGVLNVGYGDPPDSDEDLAVLADRFQVSSEALRRQAEAYHSRPPFVIEMAKQRVALAARLIGEIVERHEAVSRLRHSEADLRMAQRIAAIGNWSYDPAVAVPKWSDEVYRIYERDPADGPMRLVDYFQTSDSATRTACRTLIERAIHGGEPFDIRLMLELPSGQPKWIHVICEPEAEPGAAGHRLRGTIQDITALCLAEVGMRRQESQLRQMSTMLDMAPASVTVHTKDGRFLYANRTSSSIHGLTHAEFMATSLSQLDGEESAALIEQRVAMLEREGEASFEVMHRRKDGSLFPLEVFTRYVDWESEQVILSVAVDITERKRHEEEIAESRQRLTLATSAADIGIWDWDIVSDQLTWDDQMFRLYGITERSTTYSVKVWETSVHPDDRAAAWDACQSAIRGEQDFDTEFRIRWPDGTVRHIKADAVVLRDKADRPIRMIGINHDITERKTAEEALRASEARFRILAEHFPDGVLLLFNKELRFISANGRELAKIGLCEEDIVGRTVAEVFPEEADTVMPHMQAALAGESRSYEVDYRGQTYATTTIPVTDDGSGVEYGFAITQNVTEARRMQELLRQMEKMDAIGQLAGGVAHDFNNQLTGILGYAQLLGRRVADERSQVYLERIRRCVERSSDLTAQLLTFSRQSEPKCCPTDIHMIIEETVSILERSIDKRITIHTDCAARDHIVVGDPSQLQNAMLNLAINARDAMPDGGELTFSTTILEEPPSSDTDGLDAGRAAGSCICIRIADTGSGMSSGVRRRLFEPFFTTKPTGKGTGMGLATVYGTVRQHGGSITVESEVDQGTSFTVLLPLAHMDVPSLDVRGAAELDLRGRRILLVEDEPDIRDLVVELLASRGCQVDTAADGRQAVDHFRRHWRAIDVVVLDMIMPQMGGRETFQALQAIDPEVRVVIASGFSLRDQAHDLGAKAFLEKPYLDEDLLARLADACA